MLKRLLRAFWSGPSAIDVVSAHDSSTDEETHISAGRALLDHGRTAEARLEFEAALDAAPESREALFALGLLEASERRYKAARRQFELMVARDSLDIEAHNALANVNRLLGDHAAAERGYRAAHAIDPGSTTVLANLGACLKDAGRLDEALQVLDAAIALESGIPDVILNRATVLVDLGRVEEAEVVLRALIASDREFAEAHMCLSHILLQDGRFSEGWEEYAWHYASADARPRASYAYPVWNGEELRDAPLLLRGMHGLGDQIMFASCLSDVGQLVDRCILECDERLVKLFARSFPRVQVCGKRNGNTDTWARNNMAPAAQAMLSGLPRLFRKTAESFPRHDGYLKANSEAVRFWRRRLDQLGPGLKVGLSWRGGAAQTRRSLRSIPLDDWHPILSIPGIRFVSLQYGDCEDEIAKTRALSGVEIFHDSKVIDDYDQTAALVSALDLVVSVQTSVVHLAGALSKRVWVAVPATPEWRYMRRGDAMPWYPSAVLYRQQTLFDWSGVIEHLRQALVRDAASRT